jgi:hypothetical protein
VTTFIALYRGPSVAEAQLIAVSSEPAILDRFMRELAGANEAEERGTTVEREPLRVVRDDEE